MSAEESANVTEAQRRFAAQLAQNPSLSHSSILDRFSLPQANATAMQATLQYFGQKLGCIRDLLHELDSLTLDFPSLSEIAYLKDAVLRLSFLDLESESKFSVYLKGGRQLTPQHTLLPCSSSHAITRLSL